MAVKNIIYFFIVSSIVIVESKVCTKLELVPQSFIESYEKLSIVTYKVTACDVENVNYDSYYGSYGNYDTTECVKSKWITIPATRIKQKLTTKIVKYCCEGYYREYSTFFGADDFICVPVLNTTENSKEIMTELMTSSKADGLEDAYDETEITTYEAALASYVDSVSDDVELVTDSIVDQTTRRSDNTKETSKATESMTSVTYGTKATYTTVGSVIDQTTRRAPDTRGLSTASERRDEATDPIIDQTTTSSDFTNDTWNASERTWMGQHWPVVIIPVVLIIAVATLLVWRWSFIKIFLTGKYDVNDDKRTSQNACAKVQPTNSQTTTTIELNGDM